jgi:hypothetical protein
MLWIVDMQCISVMCGEKEASVSEADDGVHANDIVHVVMHFVGEALGVGGLIKAQKLAVPCTVRS